MNPAGFKDHFSGHAAAYAQARPEYPPALFDWLAATAPGQRLAWDVATGNGQAARGLAPRFERVHATDASAQQVAEAHGPANVHFATEPAERCSLPAGSVDLVCVAQALHWFQLDAFWAEARRVLRPGGLLAAWTYGLNRVTPAVDAVVRVLYADLTGPYWPPERRHVEAAYRDLAFPFAEITVPELPMQTHASLPQFLAYLRTWSAVQRYQADRAEDPVALVEARLARAWGDPQAVRTVDWPLAIRAGCRQ